MKMIFPMGVLLIVSITLARMQGERQGLQSTGEKNPAPGTYEILSRNGRIVIPFEFYRNKLRFKSVTMC